MYRVCVSAIITYLLTDLLHEVESFLKDNRFSASQEITTFITAFTSTRNLSLSIRSYQSISVGPRVSGWTFRNKIRFHGEELLAPPPTPKLQNHPLSAVRDCLLNIFAAALHIGGRSSIPNLRKCHAVVTGTHSSRTNYYVILSLYLHIRCGSSCTLHWCILVNCLFCLLLYNAFVVLLMTSLFQNLCIWNPSMFWAMFTSLGVHRRFCSLAGEDKVCLSCWFFHQWSQGSFSYRVIWNYYRGFNNLSYTRH